MTAIKNFFVMNKQTDKDINGIYLVHIKFHVNFTEGTLEFYLNGKLTILPVLTTEPNCLI